MLVCRRNGGTEMSHNFKFWAREIAHYMIVAVAVVVVLVMFGIYLDSTIDKSTPIQSNTTLSEEVCTESGCLIPPLVIEMEGN